jgi:DNA-binding response OmpR family regulator
MAHIIIADDDDIVAEAVFDAFARYGHAVGIVTNGADALKAVRAKTPDLLILDCNMPEMGGLTALREIRMSAEFYQLPIMMLTGRLAKVDVDLALREGADAYVKKPFDPDYLVFRAEEVLEKRRLSGVAGDSIQSGI